MVGAKVTHRGDVYRIHGDNILECERALFLVADSVSGLPRRLPSPLFMSRYEINIANQDNQILLVIELLAGHGRWRVDIAQVLQAHGAPLREATDAVLTRVSADGQYEEIVLAFEFCRALPAGNNAWQRHGRALSFTAAGVPYLFIADIGGVELDVKRNIKASRFPNPIVPFAYLTAGAAYDGLCAPVYEPSPSSSASTRQAFAPAFGLTNAHRLIQHILQGASTKDDRARLTYRALQMSVILSQQRQRASTLDGEQWSEFLGLQTVTQKVALLERHPMSWSRKATGKVAVSRTFSRLVEIFQRIGSLSVGAKDIPICLIPQHIRPLLLNELDNLYSSGLIEEFRQFIAKTSTALIVVWITGFKPRGDDSRPDRGLVPLARMLFGDDAEILSIVYGPAKATTWDNLRRSPQQLARKNGLWEAIINLSDALLVDSATVSDGPLSAILSRSHRHGVLGKISLPAAVPVSIFSEHDVDSALHLLFSQQASNGFFEAMCNPPGGDWSGLSISDVITGEQFRWTSLPRVSSTGKRPDHVIQILADGTRSYLLSIESKSRASDLEEMIGPSLKEYTRQLVATPPTIQRVPGQEWQLWPGRETLPQRFTQLSGGAFCWLGVDDLEKTLSRCSLDMVLALEFHSVEQPALLHIKIKEAALPLLPMLRNSFQQFAGWLEVQIH